LSEASESSPSTAAFVQDYLHEHIPLSAAMGIQVSRCDAAAVELRAPLEPNLNHRATAFGGSLSAIGILAAWTWLHSRLRGEGVESRLVIQQNTIDYLLPVAGELRAVCRAPDDASVQRFLRIFQRHGRARLSLDSTLHEGDSEDVSGRLQGEFVVLRPESNPS
jgi:thioesterase domain-containing protein